MLALLLVVEQVDHVVRVLLFDREDLFEHPSRRRVAVTEPRDDLAVGADRDPLGDEVLLDHLGQAGGRLVFRVGPARERVGIEIWFSPELPDPSGDQFGVTLLLS